MSRIADRRDIFLNEIGIGPRWRRRSSPPAEARFSDVTVQVDDSVAALPMNIVSKMSWLQLNNVVLTCQACGLCNTRTNAVFGVGDEKAKWLFVGEGPGYHEDRQGVPFVGPSGKLLDNMLTAMGLKRGENTYIANIVKCRPVAVNGGDRAPTEEEAAACRPYLERQIALIQPSIIVALGKTAALSLLGSGPDVSVSALRGSVHRYGGPDEKTIPLVVTYHPAYLLRRPAEKAKVWADLCLAQQVYAG